MIEVPKIAKQSAGFPDPVEAGRICELCGGRTFSILHGWESGNRWNPIAIPIAVWKCTCAFTFLHPVPAADQLPDKGDWWSDQRKAFTRKRRLKAIWNDIRARLFWSHKKRFLWYIRKVVPSGRFLVGEPFLRGRLRKGRNAHECVGIDPSPTAVECAKRQGYT